MLISMLPILATLPKVEGIQGQTGSSASTAGTHVELLDAITHTHTPNSTSMLLGDSGDSANMEVIKDVISRLTLIRGTRTPFAIYLLCSL